MTRRCRRIQRLNCREDNLTHRYTIVVFGLARLLSLSMKMTNRLTRLPFSLRVLHSILSPVVQDNISPRVCQPVRRGRRDQRLANALLVLAPERPQIRTTHGDSPFAITWYPWPVVVASRRVYVAAWSLGRCAIDYTTQPHQRQAFVSVQTACTTGNDWN